MSFTLLGVHREIIFCVGSVEMEVWERHFTYIIVHSSCLNYFSSAFLSSEKCGGIRIFRLFKLQLMEELIKLIGLLSR